MSDNLTTRLARPTDDPATRAAAIARIQREPDPEFLVAVLGLDDAPVRKVRYSKGLARDVRPAKPKAAFEVRDGKTYCTACMRRCRADGVCRRPACGGAR